MVKPAVLRGRGPVVILLLLVPTLLASGMGCRAPDATSYSQTVWQPLGSWTGHGRFQTESFDSLIGTLRIRWKTTHSNGSSFKLTLHSAISGRRMGVPVEHVGDGDGIAYFADTPHMFFGVVDSEDADWTLVVEEPVNLVVTRR